MTPDEIKGLNPEAFIDLWDGTIDKMVRHHDNISTEVQQLIITIQKTRDGEGNKLVPTAEEKALYGKVSLCSLLYCHPAIILKLFTSKIKKLLLHYPIGRK